MNMDVENEASILACFKELETKNHSIDLLFNNAGVIDWMGLFDVDSSSIEKIYKVNLVGCLLVTRAAIKSLQNAVTPLIVNLSSRLGSIDLRGDTQLGGAIAYQCSKAALNMLTKQSAIDLKNITLELFHKAQDGYEQIWEGKRQNMMLANRYQ